MLAQETRRVMKERKWTLRHAERETGLNFATVDNMLKGRSVSPETLVIWANAIKEDPDLWLLAAGKPYRSLRPEARQITLPSGLVVEIRPVPGSGDVPSVSDADRLALVAFFADAEPQ